MEPTTVLPTSWLPDETTEQLRELERTRQRLTQQTTRLGNALRAGLVRCWASRPQLDPRRLDAVIVSHHHIDHCTDANILIEAMTEGGYQHRGCLLAPGEALAGDSPICRYVQTFPEHVITLTDGGHYQLGDVSISTVAHQHTVETYGLIFSSAGQRVGFLVDTTYCDALIDCYRNCNLLIVNVVLADRDHPATSRHLSLWHAEQIINQLRPQRTILTHFGMNVLKNKPEQIAQNISQRLGVAVQAARDGMEVELSI